MVVPPGLVTISSFSLTLPQLLRFLGSGTDGVHQAPAHAAQFHLVKPFDGGAAWAGHHVLILLNLAPASSISRKRHGRRSSSSRARRPIPSREALRWWCRLGWSPCPHSP